MIPQHNEKITNFKMMNCVNIYGTIHGFNFEFDLETQENNGVVVINHITGYKPINGKFVGHDMNGNYNNYINQICEKAYKFHFKPMAQFN